jgi:hypothetical protein
MGLRTGRNAIVLREALLLPSKPVSRSISLRRAGFMAFAKSQNDSVESIRLLGVGQRSRKLDMESAISFACVSSAKWPVS